MSEQLSYREKLMLLRNGLITNPPKEKKPLKTVSDKKAAKDKAEKEERGDEPTELQKWYIKRQQQLTGKCIRCGHKYNHKILSNAIAATAHVLAKREEAFPSIALHPENFIELAPWCGCHNWYDNFASWEEIAKDKIWPIVLEKFLIMEPKITERHRIPEILLQEIEPKLY